jgi:hypothetical protein
MEKLLQSNAECCSRRESIEVTSREFLLGISPSLDIRGA